MKNVYLTLPLLFMISVSVAHAQSARTFTLNPSTVTAGQSEVLSVTLTNASGRADRIEFKFSDLTDKFSVESIQKISGNSETVIWLTTDSIRFSKKIPKTAWLHYHREQALIELAEGLLPGDRLQLSIRCAIAANDSDSVRALNTLSMNLYDSASPGSVSVYLSSQPVIIIKEAKKD
ncbi:hypothetical protein HUU42_12320 [bacterium]|nr:hypothetical protein [bacterium]